MDKPLVGQSTKNIIEINGKRYDAVTGTFLGSAPHGTSSTASKKAPVSRSIDGFSRSRSAVRTHAAPLHPSLSPAQQKQNAARTAHSPAIHAVPHKPQQAKTLMRTAVKKPDIKSPAHIKAQTRTDILAKVPAQVVAPKLSHSTVDPKRLKKAAQTIKSPSVSKYSPASKLTTIAPVSAMPAATALYAPAAATPRHPSPTRQISPIPTIPVSPARSNVKQPDIFEHALARAKSHEQTFDNKNSPQRKKSSRLSSLVTATMGLLLIAGILAYFNAPALSMRMASNRAGFSAKLPGYSPAGYTFGDLSFGPGNVTVSYQAEDESRKFDITQKVSGWDSQALLTNFVSSANKAYQTYERAGRTIYLYGENTATWVDSGIWYTVNGNSSLDKNQLLELAGSI